MYMRSSGGEQVRMRSRYAANIQDAQNIISRLLRMRSSTDWYVGMRSSYISIDRNEYYQIRPVLYLFDISWWIFSKMVEYKLRKPNLMISKQVLDLFFWLDSLAMSLGRGRLRSILEL